MGSPVEASPLPVFSTFLVSGYPCRCLLFRSIFLYSTVRFTANLLSLFVFVTVAFYFFTSDISVNNIG